MRIDSILRGAVCAGVGVLLLAPNDCAAQQIANEVEDQVFELNLTAQKLFGEGKVSQALTLQKFAVQLALKEWGEKESDHPALLRSYERAAHYLHATGDTHLAIISARLALAGWKDRVKRFNGPPDHPTILGARHNLASYLEAVRQFKPGEDLWRENLEILRKQQSPDSTLLARTLNGLGLMYHKLAKYKEAESHLKEAYALSFNRDENNVPVSLSVAVCNSLGYFHLEQWNLDLAEKILLSGLKWHNPVPGQVADVGIAHVWGNLAVLYKRKGEFRDAIKYYNLVCDHRKQTGDLTGAAEIEGYVAGLFDRLGEDKLAATFYEQAHDVLCERTVLEAPRRIRATDDLGRYEAYLGNTKKALELIDAARRGTSEYVGQMLPFQPRHRMGFYYTHLYRGNLYAPLTFGWLHRHDPAIAERSAGWLLNGKALLSGVVRESLMLKADLEDDSLEEKRKALVGLRIARCQLALTPPRHIDPAKWKEKLHLARKREEELAKEMRVAGNIPLRIRCWVELEEVRQGLPEGGVLIDLARFKVHDFESRPGPKAWKEDRYAAWVTPKRGKVRMVDLGPAKDIDKAIQAVRELIEKAPGDISLIGEARAEAKLMKPLTQLSDCVLKPLLPTIEHATHWLISPDAGLWLVPWEMLRLNNSYVVEKYQTSYLVTARDLGVNHWRPAKGPAVVIGNPTHKLEWERPSIPAADRPIRSEFHTQFWTQLPDWPDLGESGEAVMAATEDALERSMGIPTKVFSRDRARKHVCLSLKEPRYLVLVTHGYFLKASPPAEDKDDDTGLDQPPKEEVPHDLRIGLVFAGALRRTGQPGDPWEDTLLSGREILNVSVRGTEVVFLHNCNTGVGDVIEIEGVESIRSAFHTAGAQSVVATLWQIPSEPSRVLAEEFWTRLGKDPEQNRAAALRGAQLQMLQQLRASAKPGETPSAHPLFWAGFTLSGRWQR